MMEVLPLNKGPLGALVFWARIIWWPSEDASPSISLCKTAGEGGSSELPACVVLGMQLHEGSRG